MRWMFPSRAGGEYEGWGNGSLEMFKGDPIKSLAREICQNSLDARDDKEKPVVVEFAFEEVKRSEFPGLFQFRDIILKCMDFWKDDKNSKTQNFLINAEQALSQEKIKVLRISDFNTKGLLGAYDKESISTAWNGLVKSTAVSVKSDSGAAGSYGIGKNATFVNSYLQTVFYRTYDVEDNKAALGVARLMSFKDESYGDEDPVRRSVGYFCEDINEPLASIPELDKIYTRTEYGTDIFIPAFKIEDDWVGKMVGEILENFLMSFHENKLIVRVGNTEINGTKESISKAISRYRKYTKDAYCFNDVLRSAEGEFVDETYGFRGKGELRLRVLYKPDQNQKILVVRNTGMKIAEIPKLPRTISFSGILEIIGDELNEFFREMENPQHNKWEPKRHSDPDKARKYVDELEKWVRTIIDEKISESIGEETDLNTADYFNGADDTTETNESMVDSSLRTDFEFQQKTERSYKSVKGGGNDLENGFVDEGGDTTGYRHRTGSNGGERKGRRALINPLGPDLVHGGSNKVGYRARVVKESNNTDRLILSSSQPISDAMLEIVTMGENGKSLPLQVTSILSASTTAYCKNGKIYINEIAANERVSISFSLGESQDFAIVSSDL